MASKHLDRCDAQAVKLEQQDCHQLILQSARRRSKLRADNRHHRGHLQRTAEADCLGCVILIVGIGPDRPDANLFEALCEALERARPQVCVVVAMSLQREEQPRGIQHVQMAQIELCGLEKLLETPIGHEIIQLVVVGGRVASGAAMPPVGVGEPRQEEAACAAVRDARASDPHLHVQHRAQRFDALLRRPQKLLHNRRRIQVKAQCHGWHSRLAKASDVSVRSGQQHREGRVRRPPEEPHVGAGGVASDPHDATESRDDAQNPAFSRHSHLLASRSQIFFAEKLRKSAIKRSATTLHRPQLLWSPNAAGFAVQPDGLSDSPDREAA
eukprot:scaffold965_cov262-Pinguiococcus_pyrenoidosus.AAC.12